MIQYVIRPKKNVKDGTVKYYPQIGPVQVVSTDELVEQINQRCTITQTDIKIFIDALAYELKSALARGQSVRLGDLGSFRPTLSAKGADTASEVDASYVKRVNIRHAMSAPMSAHLALRNLKFQKYKAPSMVTP